MSDVVPPNNLSIPHGNENNRGDTASAHAVAPQQPPINPPQPLMVGGGSFPQGNIAQYQQQFHTHQRIMLSANPFHPPFLPHNHAPIPSLFPNAVTAQSVIGIPKIANTSVVGASSAATNIRINAVIQAMITSDVNEKGDGDEGSVDNGNQFITSRPAKRQQIDIGYKGYK